MGATEGDILWEIGLGGEGYILLVIFPKQYSYTENSGSQIGSCGQFSLKTCFSLFSYFSMIVQTKIFSYSI